MADAFAAIKSVLVAVQREKLRHKATTTTYAIALHARQVTAGFAELADKGSRGVKLTLWPIRGYSKLVAIAKRPALQPYALKDRKSFLFKGGITAAALRDVTALIELAAKIWRVEVSDLG